MAKYNTSTYVIEYELAFDNDNPSSVLDKLEKTAKAVYNDCLNECLKRYHKLIHDRKYQELLIEYKTSNNKKELNKQLNDIALSYGYSEYSMHEYVKKPYEYFNKKLGSHECQKIATRTYKAVEKIRYHQADKVNFKSKYDSFSIEGKSSTSKLHYCDDDLSISYGKYKYKLKIKRNDIYAQLALLDKVKYVRIYSKTIRGKRRWFVQLILKGTPPGKNRQYGNSSKVQGIDIGTSTIAVVSSDKTEMIELAPNCKEDEHKIRVLSRKLDRSRRANNPYNYNEDGTITKGKHKWYKSKNYIKIQAKLKDEYRKLSVKRKQSHEILANQIIAESTDIRVEKMNFKGLQKRSFKTTINKNGKINSKKRYGKTIKNRAPGMLLSIIDRKLKYKNLELKKIDTFQVKASQYNPIDGTYKKKQLKDRLVKLNEEIIVQRDLLSAYIIAHTNDDLETIDAVSCYDDFNTFKKLQDNEIQRLKENNQLSWYIH